jgi:RimJ/RimL family protein N-acetyltransferase
MIEAGLCMLRPWRDDDIEALPAIADDPDVARYLADRFPHPYTREDARGWVSLTRQPHHAGFFAIEVAGELAGGAGYEPFHAERRFTANIGYWLGRAFWGRGIATAAVRALADFALEKRGVLRLEALVYAPNVASLRVLEKAGFEREGVMKKAIVKHGEVLDAYLYAKTR